MSDEPKPITGGQLALFMLFAAVVACFLTSAIWSVVKVTPIYVGIVGKDDPAPGGIITTVVQSNGYNVSFGAYDGTTLPATLVPLSKQLGDVTLMCEFFDREGYSLGTDTSWFPPSAFAPKKINLSVRPLSGSAVRSAKCSVR